MTASPSHVHAGRKFVALSGGVGGAKLVLGLARVLPADALTIIVNTGDDFDHLGLRICPDIDTVCYTLGGQANRELGWGRADESWNMLDALAQLGGETWFRLGDRDLALHLERTRRLAAGQRLTQVTGELARALGCGPAVLPMSDDPVRTIIETAEGALAFQHYFVRERCAPEVRGFEFSGAAEARLTAETVAALGDPALGGIIICPSNPFVSVDPVLSVPGMRDCMRASGAPIIAVSPIIGGEAVKGPAAKMMAELGVPRTAREVARHYRGLIDGFILDAVDADQAKEIEKTGLRVSVVNTLMKSDEDKETLARAAIAFAGALAEERAA